MAAVTERITVYGMVQGIGFRPFVARLAEEMGVAGTVRNSGGIVVAEVTGEQAVLNRFVERLEGECPFGGRIDRVSREQLPFRQDSSFSIVESEPASGEPPLIPPDLPTCPRCARELHDKGNRRYRYPFISCVACGPRYSIIKALPYDRCNITMDMFPMCEDCQRDYTARQDVRRHAQTIACHSCGPVLALDTRTEHLNREAALRRGVELLKNGSILAVKDIGGYHLACNPNREDANRRLRQLKGREKKPFAVLFHDVEAVRRYCYLSDAEERLLTAAPRPIVLLKKRPGKDFAPSCCGSSLEIGAMLPCNPLQILLSEACGPLVMTSGNRSGLPMMTADGPMLDWLRESDLLDGVFSHGREILTPLDDSVVRIVEGEPQFFRRARGYVPEPIMLQQKTNTPFFAAGGDLKACFGLVSGGRVYLSQHFGDLEEWDAFQSYQTAAKRMENLFQIEPEFGVCDGHPGYFSGKYVRQRCSSCSTVQHHHAHIASVMAEYGLTGPVLGVAFDGTGYGTDGTIWGGEFLLCTGPDMARVGHIAAVPLLGGDESARNADASLTGYLLHAGLSREGERSQTVEAALRLGVNTVRSSSIGRLFDAAAALLDICHYNSYEGECAILLEQAAAKAEDAYPLPIPVQEQDGCLVGDSAALLQAMWEGQEKGASPASLALGFHHAVAELTLTICQRQRAADGVKQVALSGGTFQNRILLERTAALLRADGFTVYYNRQVPPGDGGLALGQAWVTILAQQSDGSADNS
ncbi:MAG: carbamoyltransferase HypF [Clostridiales bacterium]|nr:carbamoyltransferase HypF [Clostridiales bacterium]